MLKDPFERKILEEVFKTVRRNLQKEDIQPLSRELGFDPDDMDSLEKR